MPGFDGTGPRGLGPMTGRGEGYCAVVFPSPETARAPYGYAGLAGVPVKQRTLMDYPYERSPAYGPPFGEVSRPLPLAAAPYAPASYFLGGRPRRGMRFVRGRGRGRGPSSRSGRGPSSRSGRGRRRW